MIWVSKYIEFNLGAEKQIRVATAGQNGALFYEAYRQGLAGVIEIMRASTLSTQHKDCICPQAAEETAGAARIQQNYPLCDDEDYYNYPNNLIVFTGGRGTGKSSAMLTFVKGLTAPGSGSQLFQQGFLREMVRCELPGLVQYGNVEQTADAIHALLRKSRFVSIPPIDPTMLEEGGQILINILARMFQTAERAWEENKATRGDRMELNEKNELMHQFTICYECANALKNKKDEALDPLDLLSSLGDGTNLKRQLVQLVKKLLRFVVHDAWDDTYLVLQIDDTDMNIRRAYDILEDIRKYLVIPRLIIVMAADLDHLTQVVEGSLLSSYGRSSSADVPHTHSIASQYISKLIPQSRRICLPELDTYLKEHPDTEIRYSTPFKLVLPDGSPFPDSQEQIFRLIYRKTGVVFLRREHQLHDMIPGNMRLLGHFLSMLVQMTDVADPDDPAIVSGTGFFLTKQTEEGRKAHLDRLLIRLQNIQRFRDYFLEIWAGSALSAADAQELRELAQANMPNKVQIVCNPLLELGQQPSYADMLRILQEREHEMSTEEDSRYIYAVHTLFSLLGHSIVLEELIAHYTRPDWAETDCVFRRLYPLFGSRPFSYFHSDDCTYARLLPDGSIQREQGSGELESVPAGERVITALIPDLNALHRWFPIRWQVPPNMNMPSILQHTSTNPKFLYSMFCPYQQPGNTSQIWADFSTPILNCLYLSPSEYSTPLAEAVVPAASHTSGIKTDQWPDIQSSALLTVLNWDVQQTLSKPLTGKVRFLRPQECNYAFPQLVPALANFYQELTSPFQRDPVPVETQELTGLELTEYIPNRGRQDKEPEIQAFPVACLKNLNLSRWISWLDESQLKKETDSSWQHLRRWIFGEDDSQLENGEARLEADDGQQPDSDTETLEKWRDVLQEFYSRWSY